MKKIIVTGATGGIGAPLCTHLVKSGYAVVLAARDRAKLEQLSADLNAINPGSTEFIAVDMTDNTSVDHFASELSSRNIVPDGLVLMPPQPHRSNDPLPGNDAWTTLFQGSFIGPLGLLKHAVAAMKPDPENGKRAKIVVISGISSAQVLGHYATANVLRCAWVGQAKTLAFALGPQGIHINTLSLGGTLAPWYKEGLEKRAAEAGMSFEERLAEETANVPLRKYGEPAEVAVAVEGLLSHFSDHMTGINIMHDGGFTRSY